MRIIEETQLDFDDLLISPKRSTLNSRSEVNIFRTFNWIDDLGYHQTLECIPVIIANMGTIGIPRMAKIAVKHGFMCALEKHIKFEDLESLYLDLEHLAENEGLTKNFYTQKLIPSIGIKEDFYHLERIAMNHDIKCLCLDVPNGYISKFIEQLKLIKSKFPHSLIFAGNVVTSDICQDIVLACGGVAKVGIGGGSSCLTRLKTGVGRPQASTVIECADACHQVNGFCCSDGGVKTVGDIVKAFGCGADFVMCGGIFAGAEEAEGDVVYINNKPHKQFYGMSSNLAQERHFGGIRKYSTSEGREKYIPVVGKLEDILTDINGGIKSAMTYMGAHKLKNIPKCCTFYKVNRQLNSVFSNCQNIA